MQQDQLHVLLLLLSHYILRSVQEDSADEESNNKESEGEESEGVLLLLLLLSRYISRSIQEEVSTNKESIDKESINEESTDTESDSEESDAGDIIQHLAQQLWEFKGCSDAKHKEQAQKHTLHYC